MKESMKRASGDADNVLFLDLIFGYMVIFNFYNSVNCALRIFVYFYI